MDYAHPQRNDFDFASLWSGPPFRVCLLKRWVFSSLRSLCPCVSFSLFCSAHLSVLWPLRYLFPSFLPSFLLSLSLPRPNFPLVYQVSILPVSTVITSGFPSSDHDRGLDPSQSLVNTSRHIMAHHRLSKHKRLLLRQAPVRLCRKAGRIRDLNASAMAVKIDQMSCLKIT